MKINEVAQLVGITRKNIRFYEEQGLLAPQRDRENGYRSYSEEDVQELRRIKLLRKLGVPLEEIRQIQQGRLTLGEGMERHLALLERQKRDLETAKEFCLLLRNDGAVYAELDADARLREMELKEKEGTVFVNEYTADRRRSRTAAIAAAAVFALLMVGIIALLVWAWFYDPIPFGIVAFIMFFPAALIVGVFAALFQRLKEIEGGEEYAARNY